MGNIRRPVTVEFAKHELPVTDADIKLRMTLMLELARSEKILSLTISTRRYMTREQQFVFEGVAKSPRSPQTARKAKRRNLPFFTASSAALRQAGGNGAPCDDDDEQATTSSTTRCRSEVEAQLARARKRAKVFAPPL